MKQYYLKMILVLSIYSCADSNRKNVPIVKTEKIDPVFIPDRFENRDDTASFSIDKGHLSGKSVTLDVAFGGIACTCAQWSETKYSNSFDNRTEFFLEPANASLINADTLYNGNNFPIRISVTGQYYSKEGFPKNYRPAKGSPDPAKVFRYTKIKIISLGPSV